MINLEEYKEYLINTYKHQIDNSKEKIKNRQVYLSKYYKDEYLSKIIQDTLHLINILLKLDDTNYYYVKMPDSNINYISLNLSGGWHSDIIYEDINGNLISEYILKRVIGNYLSIDIKEVEHEFDTEDPDILSYDYEYYLYLQNFQNKLDKKLKLSKTNNE